MSSMGGGGDGDGAAFPTDRQHIHSAPRQTHRQRHTVRKLTVGVVGIGIGIAATGVDSVLTSVLLRLGAERG